MYTGLGLSALGVSTHSGLRVHARFWRTKTRGGLGGLVPHNSRAADRAAPATFGSALAAAASPRHTALSAAHCTLHFQRHAAHVVSVAEQRGGVSVLRTRLHACRGAKVDVLVVPVMDSM